MKVRLDVHHAAHLAELDGALTAIGSSGARGLIVMPSPFTATNRDNLVQFAASRRLPAMYFVEDFTDGGGLMSYGPSIVDAYRQAADTLTKFSRARSRAIFPWSSRPSLIWWSI